MTARIFGHADPPNGPMECVLLGASCSAVHEGTVDMHFIWRQWLAVASIAFVSLTMTNCGSDTPKGPDSGGNAGQAGSGGNAGQAGSGGDGACGPMPNPSDCGIGPPVMCVDGQWQCGGAGGAAGAGGAGAGGAGGG